MNRERFEELVRLALAEMPEPILQRLSNIDIEIKDWPSREELCSAGVPPGVTLLGLYQGVPHIRRGRYNLALPDRIFIYQRPIERLCTSEAEVKNKARQVIYHEVAHHFGLTDADLRDAGVY